MESIIHPLVLYAGLALGAVGVVVSMPRRQEGPRVLGALLAAIGAGAIVLALTLRAGFEHRPNLYFYIFSVIALGASLRVITHPRPVYAALYFILTILSSAGLYLILAAEFLAFALIIIYAGAILITYLFVIMLATQAPTEGAADALTEYDSTSREPVAATVVGFLLLAALTGMMATGVSELRPPPADYSERAALNQLPGKVERALRDRGMPEWVHFEGLQARAGADIIQLNVEDGAAFNAWIRDEAPEAIRELRWHPPNLDPGGWFVLRNTNTPGFTVLAKIPDDLTATNIERVGLALIGEHPLALELAGVILLLALVGAVVLARRQIEIGDEEKRSAAAAAAQRGAAA